MKITRTLCIFTGMVALVLSALLPAFAEEKAYEGDVTLKGTLAHVNGDDAKFNEYRDIKDTVTGDILFSYLTEKYFMKFNAAEIGAEDQKYSLTGGMWGKFGYDLFYNEIPHNITFGAKTFFSGAGGSNLTGVPTPLSSWSSFDYSTERKRYGAGVRLDMLNPFFLDISVQREEKKGIKPAGTDGGDSSASIELPEPIDYRTDMFRVEAGYNKKPFYAALSYDYSKFNNDTQALDFVNPFLGPDSLTLPPDNSYYKLGFKGAVLLPYRSRLSLNASVSKSRSEADTNAALLISDVFRGKAENRNMNIAFTSNPIDLLDAKVFYKYYDRKNESSDVDENFGYRKNSMGAQLGFRLPANIRFTAGYTNDRTAYVDRPGALRKNDNTYSADLAWSGLDFATFRIGYEKLHRGQNNNEEDNLWRFDTAPLDRDTFKVSVDLFPAENFSLTLGYKYKNTDYNHSGLGLKDDRRDAFFADASYALAKFAQMYGYIDYERVKSFQLQSASGERGFPATDWSLWQKEKNMDYGIGTDIYIIPKKLTLKLQYDYVRSDGSADYTLQTLPVGWTNSNVDISNWGDYRKTALSARVMYNVLKPLTITAGYAYERYRLDDFQFDGYRYTVAAPNANSYLTGAYKDPNYNANVVFLALTYRF